MSVERYTEDDVQHWKAIVEEDIPVVLERLSMRPIHPSVAHGGGWAGLENLAWLAAQASIAEMLYQRALGWLAVSVRARCRLLESFMNDEDVSPEYLSAGNWQVLLRAYASGDLGLVRRFDSLFDLDVAAKPEAKSTNESRYFAGIVKALTDGRVDEAKHYVAGAKPECDPMHEGYWTCLEAIVSRDVRRCEASIAEASVAWARYVEREAHGTPDAVCFIDGVGLVRLAEYVLGCPVVVREPSVPCGLLGVVQGVDVGVRI